MAEPAPSPVVPAPPWFHIEPGRLLRALAVLALASVIAVRFDGILAEGFISLIFLMAIMINGARHGVAIAMISAALGAVSFDLLITEPKWVITYSRPNDLVAPLVFTLCALGSGLLSGRLKDEARRVHQRNLQLEALLAASGGMQRARSADEVASALSASVAAQTGIAVALHDTAQDGAPDAISSFVRMALTSGKDRVDEGSLSAFPLAGSSQVLGVLIAQAPGRTPLDHGFMLALARMTALALERTQLASRLAEAHAVARAEELKSALLSSVSHDLRSPLTAINTAATSLLQYGDLFDPETRRDLLGGIVEESDRLNHLTTNLLQMGRLQGGPGGLSRSVLPALEMIRKVIARQKKMSPDHSFSLAAPDGEVMITADATLFDLVLTNVLQNACLYSEAGSHVEIGCAKQGDMCRITVTDEGEGIPLEEQENVFERFYRVQRGDGAPRGTGLGLAIARGFVEASHGAIELSSPVSGGRGTCIIINLPIVPNAVPSEPSPEQP